MPKEPIANGDLADTPILFRPATFERHSRAVEWLLGKVRTRAPLRGTGRSPGLAPGAWGKLASGGTITAASGLTLGTGTVKLCDRAGTVPAANESVTVYNAGSAITASGSDKILDLEWTDGDWSVCGCGGCPVTFVVLDGCAPFPPLPGATVQVKSGATVIASGTTDAAGRVTLNIGAAGTYTRVISMTGYQTHTTTFAMTCGSTYTATPTLDPAYCCPTCSCTTIIPKTLILTDANTNGSRTGCPTWLWTFNATRDNVTLITPLCNTVGTASILYQYSLFCSGTQWRIARQWSEGGVVGTWGVDSNGVDCGSPGGLSRADFTLTDCRNFSWSGTLTQISTGSPDPIGGTVTISA